MTVTYIPGQDSSQELMQLAQLLANIKQRKQEQQMQKQREAQFQMSTVMEHGGQLDEGTMQKISQNAGMSPGYLASLSEQKLVPSAGPAQPVTADQYDKMFDAGGTNVKPTGSFVSKEERAIQTEQERERAKFELEKEQAPERTSMRVAEERAITPVIVERGAATEKAKLKTELEMAPELRKQKVEDLRTQAAVTEELAQKYSGDELQRKLKEHEETKSIDFKFEKRLKSVPAGQTAAEQELAKAHARLANAQADWIETGGKDKGSVSKYNDILTMGKAAGLVDIDKSTKLATFKDFNKGSPELEQAKQLFTDNGLDYEEITMQHWGGYGTDTVRIVPKLPKGKQSTIAPYTAPRAINVGGQVYNLPKVTDTKNKREVLEKKVSGGKEYYRDKDGWYLP